MNKRNNEVNSDLKKSNTHRWLVSYADILTLLLALFIVLYGISAPNEGQYRQVSHALNKAFTRKVDGVGENSEKDLPGDLSEVMRDQVLEGYQEIFEKWENQVERDRNFSNMAFDLETDLIETIDDLQVQVRVKDDWIEIKLESDVIFSPGSSYVNYKARGAIESISKIFMNNSFNIHIEGHTDDSPISNILYPTNWELSNARATAVLRVLVDIGIKPDRLVSSGFGSEYPIATNETPEGRAKNRRVVFIIPKNDVRLNYLKELKKSIVDPK